MRVFDLSPHVINKIESMRIELSNPIQLEEDKEKMMKTIIKSYDMLKDIDVDIKLCENSLNNEKSKSLQTKERTIAMLEQFIECKNDIEKQLENIVPDF